VAAILWVVVIAAKVDELFCNGEAVLWKFDVEMSIRHDYYSRKHEVLVQNDLLLKPGAGL